MAINDTNVTDTVFAPRVKILNGGKPIPGVIAAEVSSNSFFQADKFTAQFALNADPAFGMQWWGVQKPPLLLDVQFSLDGGQTFTSLILGQDDQITMDPVKGIVSVDGRDLTSYFIDTKTQEAYVNQTSSQVIETLAAKHGMTADVTPTTTLVGRYYGAEHERITLNQFSRVTTEWNLMCSLAQSEQYDIWVTGTVVHFHPTQPNDPNPYVVKWTPAANGTPATTNVEAINLQRSMYMAKDIIVVVRSFNSKSKTPITKYSPTGARQSAVVSGKAQEFAYVIPNLTAAAAQDKANEIRENLTKIERIVSFTAVADLTLTPRNMVSLQGTGSSWDQDYFIDSVTRRVAWDGGFKMDVRCKNHTPNSSVLPTS